MSHDDNYQDPTSKRHIALMLAVGLAMPLLPMLMGWYTFLS